MSMSREFAAFVADLRYEELPPAVVDRAKGVTLEALCSALVAHAMPTARQALALMQEEEAGGGGAGTVLCSGAKLTKAGAAFVNTAIIFAGGKWDTFRMLTHPGTAILPAALAAAEAIGSSGTVFLTGVAAGYEVMERMAAEFIPTVMAGGCCARAARSGTRSSPSPSAGTAFRAARRCWRGKPASTTPMPATTAANCATALP